MNKFILRNKINKSIVTIVGLKEGSTIKVGATKCNTKDTHIKKTGVYIAEQRAIKKPCMVIDLNDDNGGKKDYHIFKDHCNLIFQDINSYVTPKNH